MNLKKHLKEIKTFLKKRYEKNLAAILIFGSANTGEWREGKSDIDVIILLKGKDKVEIEKEQNFLTNRFKKIDLKPVYIVELKAYEKALYKKASWPHWITAIKGSKAIYSTNDFKKFQKKLIKNPIPKKKIIAYIKNKDWRIDHIYPRTRKDFSFTKGLFANLRTRMQILVYFEHKKIIFDYNKCLKKLKFAKEESQLLKKMYQHYYKRKILTKKELDTYKRLTKDLTKKIKETKK